MAFEQVSASKHALPTPILLGVGSLLLIAGCGILAYTYFFAGPDTDAVGTIYPDAYYADMRAVFADASSAIAAGDRARAQSLYEEYLTANEGDTIVSEQTRLAMARNALAINIVEGVRLYKELAADEFINPQIRAAAVEEMGLLYVTNVISDKEALTVTLFSEEPYASFYDASDLERSYSMLFEHARALFPRLLSTGYLAVFYAERGETEKATLLQDELRTRIDETADTNPDKPLSLVLLGLSLLKQGYETEGIQYVQTGWERLKQLRDHMNAALVADGYPTLAEPDGAGKTDSEYIAQLISSTTRALGITIPDIETMYDS